MLSSIIEITGSPSVLTTFGLGYSFILAFYCWRHYQVWMDEKERVRRSLSAFRVLFLVSLGTTALLYYGMAMGDNGGDALAEAVAAQEALGKSKLVVRMAKLLTAGLLLMTAFHRIIRKL